MARYATTHDVVNYARNAGFTGGALLIAVALQFAENSSHQIDLTSPRNSDGSYDYGLWQINSIHGYDTARLLSDPQYNADMAFKVSGGGKNFKGPWAADFANGRYQANVTAAGQAIAAAAAGSSTNSTDKVAQKVNDTAHSITAWGSALAGFLTKLMTGSFWLRIGQGAAGVVLLLIAISIMFHKDLGTMAKGVALA